MCIDACAVRCHARESCSALFASFLLLAVWPSNFTPASAGCRPKRASSARLLARSGERLLRLQVDGLRWCAHQRHADRRIAAWSSTRALKSRASAASRKTRPGAEVEQRKLDLGTKNGIRIGMTRDAVIAKLGKPTRTAVRGKGKEFWCALYKKVAMRDRENGRVLRNTYIFKHDKLIEIAINLDSIPGCGDDDSASDEGWPWSQFY